VKDYILGGQRPWHLELDPDGTKLYVANGLTNDITWSWRLTGPYR
jgi:DNA-binding beta-propeller fold protein YncE